MNRQTILLISDMRQVYLAEIMTKRGLNVRCLDIRNSGTVKEQLEKLKSFLAEADMLILPIPVTKIPEQKMLNDILNKNLTNDTLVLGGCFSTEQQELLERRDIHYLDFMRDEIVTEENAVATAEGVIAELVNHSPYNIEEAKIIVTGYGCCGRAVAARLKALGGNAGQHGSGTCGYRCDHPRTAAGCIYFRHRVQTGRYGFCLRQRVRHPCGSGTWTSGKICAEGERLYSGPGGGEIRAKGA